jgi:hypothetical protein
MYLPMHTFYFMYARTVHFIYYNQMHCFGTGCPELVKNWPNVAHHIFVKINITLEKCRPNNWGSFAFF